MAFDRLRCQKVRHCVHDQRGPSGRAAMQRCRNADRVERSARLSPRESRSTSSTALTIPPPESPIRPSSTQLLFSTPRLLLVRRHRSSLGSHVPKRRQRRHVSDPLSALFMQRPPSPSQVTPSHDATRNDRPISASRGHRQVGEKGVQSERRPNSRRPVNPSRCSGHAHTRHQRSPLGESHRPVQDGVLAATRGLQAALVASSAQHSPSWATKPGAGVAGLGHGAHGVEGR